MSIRPAARIWLALLITTVVVPANGGTDDDLRKFSLELVHQSPGFLLRLRPYDHVSPTGTRRIDVMLGKPWGRWNAYLYWKADNHERMWLGTRVDTTWRGPGGRLSLVLQFRGFLGLNADSRKHLYLISNLRFRLDSAGRVQPGLLGFSKVTARQDPVLYLGPSLALRFHRHLGARLSYGPNWLGSGSLLYLKLYLYL